MEKFIEKYSNITDEQLCKLAQEGDKEAENQLVERYLKLVRTLTRPYFLLGEDNEDLLQEGMIGLLFGIRNFDSIQCSKFFPFAVKCVKNRIINEINRTNAGKNTIFNTSISLDGIQLDIKEDSLNPEDYVIDLEKSSEFIKEAQKKLSSLENRVFKLFIHGYSISEIASIEGKEKKSIDNCVQRIKKKLQSLV